MNDDLISRQEAIDAVETIGFDFSDSDLSAAEIEEVCEAIGEVRQAWSRRIKRLPSAQPEKCEDCENFNKTRLVIPQPERKTGKWIIKDNPGTGWYRVTCSECGEDVTSTIPMIGFFPNAKPLWDYCPYCGAKMEE